MVGIHIFWNLISQMTAMAPALGQPSSLMMHPLFKLEFFKPTNLLCFLVDCDIRFNATGHCTITEKVVAAQFL